ncbi:MAG: hypothetical protein KJ593_02455 [Candidatus Omnitrophica bacterium]|nr:hypothetical protein [Candidatus Omnitrophota bacterium]
MKKNIVFAFAAIVFIAFFLPWVSVGTGSAVGKLTKIIQGEGKQAQFMSISGFQVPVMANSKESKLMVTVIKIFQPGITNADKKSYLIWVVPLMAIIMSLAARFFKDNKWVHLAIAIIGVLIFVVAVFKIATTDLDKVVMKVNIESGLWLVFIGYLGIGVLSVVEFLRLFKAKVDSD